jgi:hypothetical protein
MSRINKFYHSFRRNGLSGVLEVGPDSARATADNRRFVTRLRHGLIAALAGDSFVMLNTEVALAETVIPGADAMLAGNTFKHVGWKAGQ